MPRLSYLNLSGTDDQSIQTENDGRRGFLKGLGVLATGGITLLAGCQGGNETSNNSNNSNADVSNLTEVPEIEMWGPTPKEGTEYQTAKLAYEHMADDLPLPIKFVPRKHSRSVVDAFNNHKFTGWYSKFALRPERIDPHALLISHLQQKNIACGSYNISEYSNEAAEKMFDKADSELDRKKRQKIIKELEAELATLKGDIAFSSERGLVFPRIPQVWNSRKFSNVQITKGLGIRNIWTFNEAKPNTDDTSMTVILTAESSSLNPLTSDAGNRSAVRNVYDTLTKLGKDGSTKKWLATDWSISDNSKTFSFDIRSGVNFHDGKPLTTEDVAFAYKYQRKNSPYIGKALKRIKKIERENDKTVKFTFQEPFAPAFIYLFNRVPILPKHIWEKVPSDVDVNEPFKWAPTNAGKFIGSGHMKFIHWRKGSEIKLEKNSDHWRPPKLEGLLFNVITNTQSILSGLKQENLDLMWQPSGVDPSTLVDTARNNDNLSMKKVLSTGARTNIMNTKTGPFSFPEVRAAVESVIPKKVIVEEVWEGLAEEGHGQYSKAVPFWYNDNQKKWGASYTGKKEAIKILEARGFVFKNGKAYYPKGESPPKELDGYGC